MGAVWMVKEDKTVAELATGVEPLLALAGSRIRSIRRRAKLKQSDIANTIGTGQSYIVSVEAGEQNITLKTLARIAEALKVSPATFLLEGEMALIADEGGFDKLSALLRAAMQDTDRVSDLLQKIYALVSARADSSGPAISPPSEKNQL